MTPTERRDLNEKIGRELFGWTPYPGGETPPPYCTDSVYVVPLAEALVAAGWAMGEIDWDVRGYRATLMRTSGPDVKGDWEPTMQAALALAAARAVGESDANR